MSDNGPEYIGRDYKLFVKQWDFNCDSSIPHYPKSNGQIEQTIQTIKKTLKKAFKSNEDPYLALSLSSLNITRSTTHHQQHYFTADQ